MANSEECNGMNSATLFLPVIKTEIKKEVEDSTVSLSHHVASISDLEPHAQQISPAMQMPVHKKYCCKVCSKAFLLKKNVKRHYVIHMLERHHKCSTCSASFTHNYLLLMHIKTHSQTNLPSIKCVPPSKSKMAHKEKVASTRHPEAGISYRCPLCPKTFSSVQKINKHAYIHSVEMPFKCRHCINRFSVENDLLEHVHEVHDDNEPYGCHYCSKTYGFYVLLEKHLLEHDEHFKIKDKHYECQFCMKLYSRSAYLLSHVRRHLGERPYSCDMCSKTFKRKSSLNQHYRTHTGEKPFKCHFCSRQFPYKRQCETHVRRHHTDITKRDYRCSLCCKSFMDKRGLTQHLGIHNRKFKCEICAKTFGRNPDLIEHMRGHTGEKPFTCQHCHLIERSYARRRDLVRHEREYHGIDDEKPHKCPHCFRSFAYLSFLDSHLKKEHEPIICDVCQLSLTSREELKAHMNEHTMERSKCQVCLKTFTSEFGLTLHMRIHTGEKQLKCKRCKVLRSPMGTKQKPCLECANLNEGSSLVSVPPEPVVIEMKPDIKFGYD